MIVRIQGEGQWELADAHTAELNALDERMVAVLKKDDDAAFASVLSTLLSFVRDKGRELRPEEIRESDLILPHSDATLDEVTKVFSDEGLIPG